MSELCYLCLGAPSIKRVAHYRFDVCATCWSNAESGWPQQYEESLRQALSKAGLLIPDRNERGRYPREYTPPADHAL